MQGEKLKKSFFFIYIRAILRVEASKLSYEIAGGKNREIRKIKTEIK